MTATEAMQTSAKRLSSRSALIFFVGVTIADFVSYYLAGIVAQVGLGAGQYYPPSPTAISFLKPIPSQASILPAQVLRGLLFGVVLLPFRSKIMELGRLYGGLSASAVIFVAGELASSGGVIERFVYYTPIPLNFVIITVTEVLIQALLFGQLLYSWEKRFNRTS